MLFFVALAAVEIIFHAKTFAIARPAQNLDPPFYVGCQNPVLNGADRANATFVMLARNRDIGGALSSIRSVQDQFNHNFHYPWVFLNDEPWTENFVTQVSDLIAEYDANAIPVFEVIPENMWGYPDWIDRDKARSSMDNMKAQDVPYAGKESYHHMCRFNSGFFFDHHALLPYKWYWRVEPSISFTCAITYDPFVEMERHDKRYGYTVALWEVGKSVPSLFRKIADWKASRSISTTTLWTAMMQPSYLPWPLRSLAAWLPYHDSSGDSWNLCHFWSNFEIADMDLFRSSEYRDLFHYLDQDGGFYYERWGDAPVHSLAAALLLRPDQVHHFAEFGYTHSPFQYCPWTPTPDELQHGGLVPSKADRKGGHKNAKYLGCNCKCDSKAEVIRPTCFNRLRQTVM
ncbi:glycolipid 2-alpha-mannosyltransferase-domain-containing protein [Stachybotrys elegans]|uniref:Glycolipid 2-alpha-mannosyltransferase-domain-containing protein n=1 Tax=Stachybotrys elegans TaxID=80388 RepID=A0A8K0WJZ8_9HYPO|nr:glycolipid 2-alpha-mannosyltransferase-domain-containing protein [Stachybotrys elegans]